MVDNHVFTRFNTRGPIDFKFKSLVVQPGASFQLIIGFLEFLIQFFNFTSCLGLVLRASP